ncbi:hypothetical protein BKA70DRAFT_313019 [Coprinopsis sp. MPI-PUGE-AT-0042]|nr:hypothetical protein BKA70DRAFT_313019 [Coprinopsis sp. MPI-PUGE-AT-0042]
MATAKEPSLQPLLHDPLAAPPVDTSPTALGIGQDQLGEPHGEEHKVTQSRVKQRISSVVEKTVDKLSRSVTVKSSASSTASTPTSSSRRSFSLRKKGRTADDGEQLVEIPRS